MTFVPKSRGRQTRDGYLMPLVERKAGDPTEYDLAAKSLNAKDLTAWVRRWYRSRYVPEDVLDRMGLEPDEGF